MITIRANIIQSTKESVNNNSFSGHINLMISEHETTHLQLHLFLNSLGCTLRMRSHLMLSIPLPPVEKRSKDPVFKEEWINSCMEYPSLIECGISLTDESTTSHID